MAGPGGLPLALRLSEGLGLTGARMQEQSELISFSTRSHVLASSASQLRLGVYLDHCSHTQPVLVADRKSVV